MTSSRRSRPSVVPPCTSSWAITHGDGRDLLSTLHLLELVPDIAERDVYLCGPPAMAAYIRKSVRAARVPRRQVHAERFALT